MSMDGVALRTLERLERLERLVERISTGETPLINQIGYAVGVTSSPTTTSTSYVDVTDLSVTLTTTGGPLIAVTFGTYYDSAAGSEISLALKIDALAEVGVISANQYVASNSIPMGTLAVFAPLSAGSHTVKARWKVSTGTGTAYLTQRRLLVVELQAA